MEKKSTIEQLIQDRVNTSKEFAEGYLSGTTVTNYNASLRNLRLMQLLLTGQHAGGIAALADTLAMDTEALPPMLRAELQQELELCRELIASYRQTTRLQLYSWRQECADDTAGAQGKNGKKLH